MHLTKLFPAVMSFALINACSCLYGAPRVFTGYDFQFAKAAFAEPELAANQDPLTPGVILTRADTGGLFNIAEETIYSLPSSPVGTEWAFPHNNPSATISASNWEALNFDIWEAAFGGSTAGGPPSTLNQNAVVHLIDEDIYLDFRLTGWGIGFGAGGDFAYARSIIIPEPAANVFLLLGAVSLLACFRQLCSGTTWKYYLD